MAGGAAEERAHRGAELTFPIVDTGWFMTRIAGCTMMYMDERMTPRSFERYLVVLRKELDGRAHPTAVLYEVPDVWSLSPLHRVRMAQTLNRCAQRNNYMTAGFVLVTQSAAVRGVLTAVRWLVSPEYPIAVRQDLQTGFDTLAEHAGGAAPKDLRLAYESVKLGMAGRLRMLDAKSGS